MHKEHLEKGGDVSSDTEIGHQGYLKRGGIINEKDYHSALSRSSSTTEEIKKALKDLGPAGAELRNHIKQAENISKFAGIELHSTEKSIDPRVLLYSTLRGDVKLEKYQDKASGKSTSIYFNGVQDDNPKLKEKSERHHSEMTDARLFAEALRMLGDTNSLNKMKTAYHTNRPLGTCCPLCGQTQENEGCL
ncbi:MAG TPA: hypothetical protein VJC06_02530 [Candidatus Paceibacterota bacterium]